MANRCVLDNMGQDIVTGVVQTAYCKKIKCAQKPYISEPRFTKNTDRPECIICTSCSVVFDNPKLKTKKR